ncbi:MAG: carbon monoxide dehydrogenase, partial [Acidimicrobiales bacterium]|nr:carbon monoxide dehydrogenase [Acidimicrobiales bacterium]
VEPVDLLGATGAPMLKRLAPVVGVVFALLVASRVLRRRRRRG